MRKLFLIGILFLSFIGHIAHACSCGTYYEGVDSLAALKEYDFIALVKITSEKNYKKDSFGLGDVGITGIKVIEQFKGNVTDGVFEHAKNTSCDLGIEVGEEWIMFAKMENGKPSIQPCDRNIRYRDVKGLRDWHFERGIRELRDLRRLYAHSSKPIADGIHRTFYPNGQKELDETYAKGLKDGPRTVYYPDGTIWGKQSYVSDSLQGESLWYYPSGQLFDHKFFESGKIVNVSRTYYDSTVSASIKKFLIREFYKTEDSLRLEYSRIQVQYEVVYDHQGREILSREYSRLGKLQSEYAYQPGLNSFSSIYYHDNGLVKSVGFHKNYNSYGHYQEYDDKGNPSKSWDYDESGRQINVNLKR